MVWAPPTGLPAGAVPFQSLDSPAQVVARSGEFRQLAVALLNLRERMLWEARSAYAIESNRLIAEKIDQVSIEALRGVADGGLRLGAVKSAGFSTVGELRRLGPGRLASIPGVGPKTAAAIQAAVTTAERAVSDAARVRFDVERRPNEQTALLHSLSRLDRVERRVAPIQDRLAEAVSIIDSQLPNARRVARRSVFQRKTTKQRGVAACNVLSRRLASPDGAALHGEALRAWDAQRPPADVWQDYIAHSVRYNGRLIEVSGHRTDAEASAGFLPAETVSDINSLALDTTMLKASLRGYQAFGAKFAVVRRRTILGDEMGLGKTIEALAVMCHMRRNGATHLMVVCPASVLANWNREILTHTELGSPLILHGPERQNRLRRWTSEGGVALTTFATLASLDHPEPQSVSCVVVDEAHYVKNPEANRTVAVRRWLQASSTALLMSGTPMENRVAEFKTLVSHVQPEVARRIDDSAGLSGADAFRRKVASVYLRRNQQDVLDELPDKIETPDWLNLVGESALVYERAVLDGNMMAMRRAAFMTTDPADSPKLRRLLEIVEEALANDRKVVVFSFFLDVIGRVADALPGIASRPLTGGVAPADRQRIIDEFSVKDGPAVLVGQIEAGGVGLNIQAASVVILCEPQWKPSTEDQAVARCHRMGQVRPVEVHRLLTLDSVDERMVELLREKTALFDEYARASALKEAAPQATDSRSAIEHSAVSQVALERQILADERARLGIVA